MTQTGHRDHTFQCDHCGKKITAWITSDENIPGTEEYHRVECRQGPVHRMVDFDVSLAEHGNAACGDTVGQRLTTIPSNVTCKDCHEQTAGLQLRGFLELVCQPGNAERIRAPESVRTALGDIWTELQQE